MKASYDEALFKIPFKTRFSAGINLPSYRALSMAVDKIRNMEHSGTCRNIPEHSGTFRNIPEHAKIKIIFMKKKIIIIIIIKQFL